jgi:putative transposase
MELIYPKGPWTGLADVEFATLTYVDWFNHRRLHGGITPVVSTDVVYGGSPVRVLPFR